MMKTLRKLAAIFCALGMLVPSVAMATFGSTFGDRWTWGGVNFVYAGSNDTWPATPPVPIGCFDFIAITAGNVFDCVTTGTSAPHSARRESIRAGDILRRVDCHATRDAGAGDGTATLAIYNAESVSGSNIEMAEMVISYASAINTGSLRSFDFNVAASFDGFYALGLKSITQGTTTGGFGWSCKTFWEGSS